MKQAAHERLKHPRPRDVNGFSDAASRGLVPLVPSSPPTPTSGVLLPSAHHVFTTGLAKFLAVSGVYVLFVFGALQGLALPDGIEVGILLGLGAGWFILMLRTFDGPGQPMLDEAAYGYTTFDTSWPNYFGSSEHSWDEGGGPPWDNSGLWILDRKFTVQSVPNRQVDPPGFYPSPHRAGQWELWTGVVWSGTYRNDPWPRTRPPAATSGGPAATSPAPRG